MGLARRPDVLVIGPFGATVPRAVLLQKVRFRKRSLRKTTRKNNFSDIFFWTARAGESPVTSTSKC